MLFLYYLLFDRVWFFSLFFCVAGFRQIGSCKYSLKKNLSKFLISKLDSD